MIVENSHYKLELDDASGSLLSFRMGSKEFIAGGEERSLFTIRFRDAGGLIHDVCAREAKSVNIATVVNESNIVLEYSSFEEPSIRVQVTVSCPQKLAFTYWRIAINHETDWIVEWVDFPDVVVPNDLTARGGTGKLVWPFNEGVLVEDTSLRESSGFRYVEPNYPSRGAAGIYPAIVPSQFMAYYDDLGGLYMGAHDPDGHVKCVEYFPIDEGIRLQFRLYPGGGAYEMSYDMVLGVFTGDWHEAADIYRDWYEAYRGREVVPIADNERIPDWYADSPVIVTYPVLGTHDMDVMEPNKLFPYVNGLPHVERLANAFNSKIMALLMHWEGSAPWAPPYVWPPYGGEEALKDFADRLHDANHLLGVYCSGIGWTEQSNLVASYNCKEQFDREHLEEVMCLSPEGELPHSVICTGQRSGYDLCPTQPFTVDTIVNEVKHMIDGGIDYIQAFDQNHGGTSYFCYSKTHGHPPAPGKWQTDSMLSLFRKLQEAADEAGKKVLFGCESASAEPFISELLFNDARFNLNYFVGTPIPLYAYIYHEYINNFMGNQVATHAAFDNTKSPDNLLYRLSYSFHAGDMLTVVLTENGDITWNWGIDPNVKLPEQQPILTLIGNLNPWRTGIARSYLHEGRMLKPFDLLGVKPQVFRMQEDRDFTVSSLLTSRWKAGDGTTAQLIVNYTKEEQSFDLVALPYAKQTVLVLEKPDGSESTEYAIDSEGRIAYTVKPLSVLLIKFQEAL